MKTNSEMNLAAVIFMQTWNELTQCLLQNPNALLSNQIKFWQDYKNLCQDIPLNTDIAIDKRFSNDQWQNDAALNFIKKSYLLLAHYFENLIDDVTRSDNQNLAKKLRFFATQYLDAISPTNFASLNPDVMQNMVENGGQNIITGFNQLLKDIEEGRGQLNIKTTDLSLFKIGENIACTPGKIVYQNDLMQLIHYTPTTNQIFQVPLLIIPPWINKYYILDLQPENSLAKWLVDQGHSVFMISWVNASEAHRDIQFEDYLLHGSLKAIEIIKKMTCEEQINAAGYCIGGTLLGCTLAYLAKKNISSIKSATFITTLLDFSEPGELGALIDEDQITLLEKYMDEKGYIDGRVMAAVFNALRANDMIWASYVNQYLKGQKPKPFDLLYWNADSTNIPAKTHSFYLRNMYLNNYLVKKNKIQLLGTPLDLSEISVPSYFLAAKDDHIVPWKSCFQGSRYLGGKTKFVLTSSGHVAGVVNPPHRKKYGYWTSRKKNITTEQFIENSIFNEGSWWNDWSVFLKTHSGELRVFKKSNKKKAVGDAPGDYVKVHVT